MPSPIRFLPLAVALGLTVGGAVTASARSAASPRRAESASSGERFATAAINRYRAQNGLGPVALDSRLVRAAAYVARANAAAGTLSHDAGGSFEMRMAQTGLPRGLKAENLGVGTATFDQTLAMWQASSAHNANLLLPDAHRVGIARAEAGRGRFWAMVIAQ